MLKAKTPGASKAQRGERIDPGLKAALNTRVSQAGKPHQLALSELVPNPNNKRELVIPLQELMSALKVGTEESLVYLDDGLLVFPEREELADLGLSLISGPVRKRSSTTKSASWRSQFNSTS